MATLKLKTNVRREAILTTVGIKGGKLPADMHKEFHPVYLNVMLADGTTTTIETAVTIYPSRSPMLRESNRAHRVYVVCPDCECEIPAGRLKQHCGSKACDDSDRRRQLLEVPLHDCYDYGI